MVRGRGQQQFHDPVAGRGKSWSLFGLEREARDLGLCQFLASPRNAAKAHKVGIDASCISVRGDDLQEQVLFPDRALGLSRQADNPATTRCRSLALRTSARITNFLILFFSCLRRNEHLTWVVSVVASTVAVQI